MYSLLNLLVQTNFFVHWMCRCARAEQQSHPSSIELIWLALLFCTLIALRAAYYTSRTGLWAGCEYCKNVSLVKEDTIPHLAQASITIIYQCRETCQVRWLENEKRKREYNHFTPQHCFVLCIFVWWLFDQKNRHYSDNIRRHLLGKRIT